MRHSHKAMVAKLVKSQAAVPADSVSDQTTYLNQQLSTMKKFISCMGSLGFYERNYMTGEVTSNDFWRSCGYDSDDLKGLSWLKVVHPEDQEKVKAIFKMPSSRDDFKVEFRIRARTGEWRWVLTRGLILARDENGCAVQFVGIDTDITEQKENEAELRLQQLAAEQRALEADTLRVVGAVVAASLEPAQAISRILEQAHQVLPFEFARVYRYAEHTLENIGMASSDGTLLDLESPLCMDEPGPHSQVVLEEHALIFNKVHHLFTPRSSGGNTMRSWLGVPVFTRGAMTGMMAFETSQQDFYTDEHLRMAISFADYVGIAMENARLYQELKSLAVTDELTGLLSRRWIQDYAQRLLEQSIRNQNDLSVFMIDVDWFKRINDKHGHLFGDKILKSTAQICSDRLRAGDIICRYGGEEFLAVLPQTGTQEAFLVAERLRIAVESACFDNWNGQVTISIGLASLSGRNHESLYELIHEADTALYSAKHQGRNQTVIADIQS